MTIITPRKAATFNEENAKDGLAKNQERSIPAHKSLRQ